MCSLVGPWGRGPDSSSRKYALLSSVSSLLKAQSLKSNLIFFQCFPEGRVLVGAQRRGSTSNGAVYTNVVETVGHPRYDRDTDDFDYKLGKKAG